MSDDDTRADNIVTLHSPTDGPGETPGSETIGSQTLGAELLGAEPPCETVGVQTPGVQTGGYRLQHTELPDAGAGADESRDSADPPLTPADPPLTPAAQTLYRAALLIDGERHACHGDRHESFARIARLWSAYLGRDIAPAEAAMMLALVKAARTRSGAHNTDDYTDLCGYGALAGQLASELAGA